jgi:hypothetical protein
VKNFEKKITGPQSVNIMLQVFQLTSLPKFLHQNPVCIPVFPPNVLQAPTISLSFI